MLGSGLPVGAGAGGFTPWQGEGVTLRSDQKRWDRRFRGKRFALGKKPNPFLKKHIALLSKGRALDIASGEGRNAVFLAQHGFDVDAVDISEKGLRKARKLAREMETKIHTLIVDLDTYQIEKERYDLINNFYFLNRKLIPKMKRGLKKGGMVIFETYILEHRNLGTGGPKTLRYFLKPNELLKLFKEFRILFYREGIFRESGKRKAIASLIAQKP
jgi:SAM-dependent methyltransferase